MPFAAFRLARSYPAPPLLATALLLAGVIAAVPASARAQATAPAPAPPAEEVQRDPAVGWLELSGELREGPLPYAWVTADDAGPSLQQVLSQLNAVATQDHFRGVVVYLDRPALRLTQIQAIGSAIQKVRDADKKVMVFSESYELRDYLLASYADLIILQHRGSAELSGISMEEMYLLGLLEKIGIKADLMQVGKFKGADENLTRNGPSEHWSKNIDALLDDMYGQIVETIAKNREWTRDEFEALMKQSWQMSDADYVRTRLVDRLADRDLINVTEIEFGEDFVWDNQMGVSPVARKANNPLALMQFLFQEPATRTSRATIAMIHAAGPITSGRSARGDGMFGSEAIGSRTMTRVLGAAADDDNIKGVIIRIDSPGGSALASEIIWQSVRRLADRKAVYVSVGNMAASGGYYIASAGDQIYVAPQSIVGSIGVVTGKLALGGLYEKLGIDVYRRPRGPYGDLFNSTDPFTEAERKAVLGAAERIYDQFLNRVNIGRGNRLPDVSAVAEGRLFTGRQAVKNGMADKLGGSGLALNDMREALGLQEGQYDVLMLPPPQSLQDFLNDIFASQMHAAAPNTEAAATIALAKQVLGPRAWQAVSRTLTGLMLLQDEQTLAIMPQAIVVR